MPKFVTLEEFSVASEITDTTVKVKLRRQLDHTPTQFSPAPYCIDLTVGAICRHHYGLDEKGARETVVRFLLDHIKAIAPPLH